MQQAPQHEIDYIRLLMHCLQKWYWFVLGAFVMGAGAFLYLQRQTNKYPVQATIMIRTDANSTSRYSSSAQADMLQVMGFTMNKQVKDEIKIMQSMNIMEQVVRSLGLQVDYRKKSRLRWVGQYPTPDVALTVPAGYLDTLSSGVLVNIERIKEHYQVSIAAYGQKEKFVLDCLDGEPLPTIAGDLTLMEIHPLNPGDKMRISAVPLAAATKAYQRALGCAQADKESNVINISMVSSVPQRAQDIINKVIDLYNMDAVIDKNIMATNTGEFINDRLAIVSMELDTVESAVETYMKENGLTNIESELQITLRSQEKYQNQLFEVETQLNLLTYVEEYLRDEKNAGSLIPGNLGISDQGLTALVKDYNALMLERMRVARSTTEQNPVVLQAEERLATMRASILSSIANQKEGLRIQKADILRQDAQVNHLIAKVPQKERRYMEIKRQQEIKEKLYIFLYQKREENALTLASTVMPAKVIDIPRVGTKVAPRGMRILGIALLIGLAIPFAIIFLLDYFNDSVKDKHEFQEVVKAPFLGEILQCKGDNAVVVGARTNSAPAELFRTIRTNMKFMLPEGKTPVILVTSAMNGEGKSFVAINTAISLALLKKRVVLVGLDIRKPTLANYLHIDFKGAVTSYLSDSSVPIDDLMIPSGVVEGLDVAPAGVIPPNPGELIQSSRVGDMFRELAERYDYIVVDTAPVSLVSDTYHLDKYADMTLFVTRANYLGHDFLPTIQEIYSEQKLHNMACVLNGVSGGSHGYGKYGYGKYGYGKYGYGHYGYGHYGYGYYGEHSKS